MIDTVGQLIDELKKYPRNMLVEISISEHGEIPISSITTKEYMGRREVQEEVIIKTDVI